MSDQPRRSLLVPVLVAGVITLAVSLLRLYGELHGESLGLPPWLVSKAAGGALSPVGIAWLVPIFGFWFGRRLAANGKRPAHAGKAILWCLLGIPVTAGVFVLAGQVFRDSPVQAWVIGIGMPLASLAALKAWRAAWLVNLCYAVLARIPVLVIQHKAVQGGWDTHYAKGPRPDMTPEQIESALMLAQVSFWPFAFTTIVGGVFAALGAMTVKQQA